MFAAILVVALVGTGRVYGAGGRSCSLTIQTDLYPKTEPLVLSVKQTEIREYSQVEQLEIARPDAVDNKGVITVDDGKQLLFACTGRRNYVKGSGKQTAYATCQDGKLKINNRQINIKSASCSNMYADSTLKITEDSCGSGDNTGTLLTIGFELDDHSWFPLLEVCHNIEKSVTHYSSHAVYGHSLRGAMKFSDRRKFSRGPKGCFPEVNPDSVYKKSGQEKSFDRILGKGGAQMYINTTTFLARGHLCPDADLIYVWGQLLTYYYVNVAPQYQPFNAGNWLAIENCVRDLASKEDETINVWTGTYGVLQLDNVQNEKRYMYLEPTKKLIPVPEVFWKIVQHPITKACTVAVGHNNVFLKEEPTPICDPKKPNGWPTLTTLSKGYTYYCDYSSFKETVTYAPNIDCKDCFEFPEN